MDENSIKELVNAAIKGVVERIDQKQINYVVSFMEICRVRDAVIASAEVQKAAEEYLDKHSHMFSFQEYAEDAISLMKAVGMPKKKTNKIIFDYLEEHARKFGRFPEYAYLFIDSCDLPPEKINTKKYVKFAENQITMFTVNDESTLIRIRCFLKHFSLSREAVLKVANLILIDAFHREKNRGLIKEVFELTKLSKEELLCAIKNAQNYLLKIGDLEKVVRLNRHYGISKSEFLNSLDRRVVAEGFLRNLHNTKFVSVHQMYVDQDIFLVKHDFDEVAVELKIKELLEYKELYEAEKLAKFTGFSYIRMKELVREKLGRFLFFRKEEVRVIAEKYGIEWGEVVKAVEKELIRNLAGRGVENARNLIEVYSLPVEFLQSKEVTEAATKGLVKLYEVADNNHLAEYLQKTFKI